MDDDYSNLKEFREMTLYYNFALKKLETELNIINQEFSSFNETNPINHLKTRIKSITSIVEKLKSRNMEVNIENTFKLNDVVGARIVCNFVDDIYEVLAKIKTNGYLNIIEEKDYIKRPKPSGYRGYHLIIIIPITINNVKKDIKAEIQLRTTAMDFWASSEHKLNYKSTCMTNKDKKELKKSANEVWKIDLAMNKLAKKQRNLVQLKPVDTKAKILSSLMNRRIENEVY